ncbi:hypothetical protein [Streptomyces sp. B93]|uniref:hypothetical protein n=1 Tax=Streptomyces sp. B93 TaxID=2824875 RepID=UPI001B36977C|nr:hypothetical protein [Streptomyces sp. B93]MBQ1090673.1 hypothetical protein [Streptomyces sp. B93]
MPFREIAEVVGRRLDVPVAGISREEGQEHFGFLSLAVGTGNPASGARTREPLGWRPEHPGLLSDLAAGHHFGA